MTEKTKLQQRIESGKPILVAEITPPKGSDAAGLRSTAKRYAGKVQALGVCDNRDGVLMSATAAASLVAMEGVEPILHMTTRDRNRIALASDCLGAQALGIRNLLCTTGTHQTLGRCRNARNVFDIDSIQLLQLCGGLAKDASLVGEERFAGVDSFCLGATAAPYADPVELQVIRLAKAIAAGAQFVITQPVFDVERFEKWWGEVTRRGLHERTAILAGIQVLSDAESAKEHAAKRPSPMIPDAVLQRLAAKPDKQAQRAAGLEIAMETVKRLSGIKGLRGFEVRGDTLPRPLPGREGGLSDGDADLAIEFIDKSGLGAN